MRNHSSVCSRRPVFLLIAGAVAFFNLGSVLHAQCPGGADPDSLGCPTLPIPLTANKEPSAPVDINESAPSESPKADSSTEASANGSLSGGTADTESGIGNSRGLHGGLPSLPEEPNEFQRFVAATTGQTLPIYGAKLFSSLPASFGPTRSRPGASAD